MTLQQFEYITALDTHRHFVKAAEACFVTQPTLTMQVKKLEDEIGIQIFDRSKKPLEPTPSGEKVILKARKILNDLKQLKEVVLDEKYDIEGDFRIGIIPTLAPYLLPIFLPEFIKVHPEVKLIIHELQSDYIIKMLHRDQLDLGLLVTPLEEDGLEEFPLFNEPFVAYLPENHSFKNQKTISNADLNGFQVLILEEGHCFRNQTLRICNPKTTTEDAPFEYQSGSIETVKNLVKKGLGYTLVPELSISEETADEKHIMRFKSPEPIREVSIVINKSFPKMLLVKELKNVILKNIPDKFTKNEETIRITWR